MNKCETCRELECVIADMKSLHKAEVERLKRVCAETAQLLNHEESRNRTALQTARREGEYAGMMKAAELAIHKLKLPKHENKPAYTPRYIQSLVAAAIRKAANEPRPTIEEAKP